jgi:hypothetical protein
VSYPLPHFAKILFRILLIKVYRFAKNKLKISLALICPPSDSVPVMSQNTMNGQGDSALGYHARTTVATKLTMQGQFWDSKTEVTLPAGTLIKLDLCALDLSQGDIRTRYVYKGDFFPKSVIAQTAPLASGCAARGSVSVQDLELIRHE